MLKPYLQVVAEKASQALNILDRFHIMSHMDKAIDKVRATEAKTLKAQGQVSDPDWQSLVFLEAYPILNQLSDYNDLESRILFYHLPRLSR